MRCPIGTIEFAQSYASPDADTTNLRVQLAQVRSRTGGDVQCLVSRYRTYAVLELQMYGNGVNRPPWRNYDPFLPSCAYARTRYLRQQGSLLVLNLSSRERMIVGEEGDL